MGYSRQNKGCKSNNKPNVIFDNQFGKTICPTGGLRSHCPNGKNCLHMHHDDNYHTTNHAEKFAVNNLTRNRDANTGKKGYKDRLRSSSDRPTTMSQTNLLGTPTKGVGLIGIVRKVAEIRNTPPPQHVAQHRHHDLSGDLFTKDDDIFPTATSQGAVSDLPTFNSSYIKASAMREKIHNLQGVYGQKEEFLATGLRNVGNMCYSNSVVQSITNSNIMVKILLGENNDKCHYPCTTLVDELGFLARTLRSGEYKHVAPGDLKEFVDKKFPQFKGYEQHDAHEFLTRVLDGIKSDIGFSNREKLAYEGVFESIVSCDVCHTHSEPKSEVFHSLQVPISESLRVESGIKEICKSEGNVDWKCTKCDMLQKSTKQLRLKVLPELLILQIKRFTQDKHGFYVKNYSRVDFSEVIEVQSDDTSQEFELCAFINHYGKTTGGHYTA